MVCHGLRKGAKDHTDLSQFVLEGGGDRDTVKHRINRNAGKGLLLFQRNAQLVVGFQKLWIHFVQTLGPVFIAFGRRVITDRLKVDGRVVNVGPGRGLHFLPPAERVKPPLQNKIGLRFFP